MPGQLIINADDFGADSAINSAVVKARQVGMLTSASLMISGKAAKEAIEIARADPGLGVGLHLTLTNGTSTLTHESIPNIIDKNSCFPSDSILAALKYHFNPKAKQQIIMEIHAQFEAFAKTGLPLSHVDGHQHLHAHPAIFPLVVELAQKYGANGIRIPYDPIWLNISTDRSRPTYKITTALGHAYLARVCRRHLENSNIKHCDIAIGSLMSGDINTDYVVKMLDKTNQNTIELFLHPSETTFDPYGPNRGDLQTLLDPNLKQFIQNKGYNLTNYTGLEA